MNIFFCKGLGDTKKNLGDVDLFGFEEPNLESKKEELENDMRLMEIINRSTDEEDMDAAHTSLMPEVLSKMTLHIREVRKARLAYTNLLEDLSNRSARNPDHEKKYTFAISTLQAYLKTSQDWLDLALEFQHNWSSAMSVINGTSHQFASNIKQEIDLAEQTNSRSLLPEDCLPETEDVYSDPSIVKQRTERWFALRKKFFVSGSTCYTAIGCNQLCQQQDHYLRHVRKLDVPLRDNRGSDEVPLQTLLDWGSTNEVCY